MEAIDIHIHGLYGFDTKDASPEEILKMATILGEKNIRGFLPTVYPRDIEEMRKDMESIKKAIAIQRVKGIKKQAKILGAYLEGPFLNPKRCGSLEAYVFLQPTEENLKRLVYGYEDIIKIITVAPELVGATKLIKKITDLGITVSMGHSDATYNEAEKGFNAGAKGITHIFNAMRPLHHREPGIVGFGLLNSHIYIELIGDLLHLNIKVIEMIFKVKHNDRIIIVSDAVKNTGLISPVVDSYGTFLGGADTLDVSAKRLIDLGFSRELILRCISDIPEMYINC